MHSPDTTRTRVEQDRKPPFEIDLAPWAIETAEQLRRQFGDDVELTVGAFGHPRRQLRRQLLSTSDISEMDPNELAVELDAPVVVASGHTVRGALRVNNMSADPVVICTNGQVTARVVDPCTKEVVGGFVGGQTLPGIDFRAAPSEFVLVPVLIGTASVSRDLGYAVPPGDWAIQVTIQMVDDGDRCGAAK